MTSVEAMAGILQEQLKRNGFDDFTKIEHQCMHFDLNRSVTRVATNVTDRYDRQDNGPVA